MTLAQARGLRLGEPPKPRGGWVVVVLAQARAPHLGGTSAPRTNSATVRYEHRSENDPLGTTQDRNKATGMD
ncbi:hypothetical protein DEO72_LG1g1703 [Vigna unguiculata]|uniref:Uncharacterized protein n=1 Tax=Vigna unguiculata TaxID=3917 RepID=A0A4D6KWM0_VIGUN|nr:hypothetical protein DEO72_LG1g1703 [Vigna unguiculata]